MQWKGLLGAVEGFIGCSGRVYWVQWKGLLGAVEGFIGAHSN